MVFPIDNKVENQNPTIQRESFTEFYGSAARKGNVKIRESFKSEKKENLYA
jgi:hypothetical protein